MGLDPRRIQALLILSALEPEVAYHCIDARRPTTTMLNCTPDPVMIDESQSQRPLQPHPEVSIKRTTASISWHHLIILPG